MNKRTLLTCLLFVVAPAAAAAAGAQPMTLEQLTAEVKSLRRLVNELIVARQADSERRCEAERDAAAAGLRSAHTRRSIVDGRRAELAEERDQPEIATARAVEIDDELVRLEREEWAPADASIAQLELSQRRIEERCEHEREVLAALTEPR